MPEPTLADLAQSSQLVVTQLRPLADDWSVPVPRLRWDARRVADHLIGVVFGYAIQLVLRPDGPTPRLRRHDPDLSPGDLIELFDGGSRLLVMAASDVPDGTRLFHPTGRPDAAGYVAMACDEILIHGADIAAAFGQPLVVPDHLAAGVVARLFPWAPAGYGGWQTLLWANGRADLGSLPAASPRWRWHAEPLDEWDGVTVPLWPERS
jgi:uncharacterized protein (TIGR03083 family)